MEAILFLLLFGFNAVVATHNLFVPTADKWLTWLPYCEGACIVALFIIGMRGLIWLVRKLP